MSEVVREPAGGPVEVPVVNPWAFCTECGGNVDSRAAGRNLPCGCLADVGSACPTWDLWFGCRCSDVDVDELEAASALQEALEDEERALACDAMVVSLLDDAVERVRTPLRPEDPLLEQAGRWRAVLGWAALVVALLMLLGLWSAGGPW